MNTNLSQHITWQDANTGILKIRVTPKASANKIKIETSADSITIIRVYVTITAEDGNANKKVIEILSKELKLAKANFKIIHGIKDRNKTIQIQRAN